jgi:soluble lytic murein transglycosylase-like protein/outer membrane protein assembly factor BamD (BamD/ComL family)
MSIVNKTQTLAATLFFFLTAGPIFSDAAVDTTGSKGLVSGEYRLALEALRQDTGITDSLFWHFKQGVAYFKCQDYEKAVEQLNQCILDTLGFGGISLEFIGDIETVRGKASDAATAFLSAQKHSLPGQQGLAISEKLYSLVKSYPELTASFPQLAALAAEKKLLLEQNKDTLGSKIDSIMKAGQWKTADSLLAVELDSAVTKKNARLVGFVAGQNIPDSAFSTSVLFRLSRAAYLCKEWSVADTLLGRAEARADFNTVVPQKDYFYHKGILSYSRSRYQDAVKNLSEYQKRFGYTPEVVLTLGRANRTLGNDSIAVYWYNKFVDLFPRHSNTPDVYWYLAWKEEEDEHFDRAAELYQRLYKNKRNSSRADEAFFRKGLCWYKAGKYPGACSSFAAFGKLYNESPFANGALYWKGKSFLAEGKTKEALEIFTTVVRNGPTDFYAYRAQEMLTLLGDTTCFPSFDTTFTPFSTRVWIDSISPPQKQQLSSKDSILYEHGTMLALCGLAEHAKCFMDGLDKRYPSNLGLQFAMASLYQYANDPTESFRIARRLSWRVPLPARAAMPLPLYRLLYPEIYSDIVVREGNRNDVDPCLLFGLIRQESVFNPDAQSRVGAIGLMQIMPFTGRALAEKLGEPFYADSLFKPYINIKYGAFYIKQVLEQFKGNQVLALASYNGGPIKAAEWYAKNKRKTFDLFIEDIGFTETRGYVKKVLANYWTYRKFSTRRSL